MSHEQASGEQLGLAMQQYIAAEGPARRFNARHFAGFVRATKKEFDRDERRRANANEERYIESEEVAARERRREESEGRLVAFARREHPGRFAELQKAADDSVPKKFNAKIRDHLVHASLIELLRKEWPDAT